MQRPCLDCGDLISAMRSRCDECQRAFKRRLDARRPSTAARGYDSTWRKRAKQLIADYRRTHHDVCPGFMVPPHPATDWVCDHDLGPCCRSCNSRKAATFDKQRTRARRVTVL